MVAIEITDVEVPTVDPIPTEARKVLHGLASAWGDVADCRDLEVVPLKGAMTNEVFRIKWKASDGEGPAPPPRVALVRIYGEGVELFFDREDEIRTFEAMSRHGQGPRLLGRFPNGRVEEFIHAKTLSAQDLRDPEISAIIAAKLREFHDLDMPGPKKVLLWDRLRNWLKVAKSPCSLEESKEFCLDMIEKEISSLETELSGEDLRIGFCHNDLQYGNVMMDEERRQITIILWSQSFLRTAIKDCDHLTVDWDHVTDYEYASFNPVAYDIANHFCEMAADYHTDMPHILDYSKYPDLDERRRFVQIYLSSSGESPKDVEVENFLQTIEKYVLASHLGWGLWGIISDHVNDIDFDYMEYARQRFQQYWLRKSDAFGCMAF